MLEDSDRLFAPMKRTDLAVGFKVALALSTNGLKGVDRKRPLGLMTVIDSGEVPEPVAVVYLPITTAKEFLASLTAIKVGVAPVRNGYALTWNGDRYALRIHRRYVPLSIALCWAWLMGLLMFEFEGGRMFLGHQPFLAEMFPGLLGWSLQYVVCVSPLIVFAVVLTRRWVAEQLLQGRDPS